MTTATATRVPSTTGVQRQLHTSGDIKIEWDREDPASIERARGEFDTLVKERKYGALGRAPGAKTLSTIREFDPSLAEIQLLQPQAGG